MSDPFAPLPGQNGKGDKTRPIKDPDKFRANFDAIFRKKKPRKKPK